MRRRRNTHRQHIRFTRFQNAGHIEDAANERAGNGPEGLAVQPHRRAIVDPLECQREPLSLRGFGRANSVRYQ